jgi:uncharacterized protein YjbJ (UPF0337 family)
MRRNEMGALDSIKGRAKRALGELTDNDRWKGEGKADQAAGKVKDAINTVSDKAKDAADAIRDRA